MECRILPRLFPCFLVTKSSSPGPRKCLGDDTKVLLLGDSTTHGLLQEALTMWSEVKPFINGLNKRHLTKLRFFLVFWGFISKDLRLNGLTKHYIGFKQE